MKLLFVNGKSVALVTDSHVGDGEFYPTPPDFDSARVFEYRLVDGVVSVPSKLSNVLSKIDADTDAIYRAVQGDRAAEYLLAESDATAYKVAGYTGTVPASVASWAGAKSKTAQWAADDILATAAAWRGAQATIRAQRLANKEQARVASDFGPVEASWGAFVTTIRAALGVPL